MQFGWTADEPTSYQVLSSAYEADQFHRYCRHLLRWATGNPGGVAETIPPLDEIQENPRHQVVIATKVRARMGDGPNDEGLSRAHLIQAVEDSLRRLQSDYIDLYQTHWYDESTPIEETLSALDDLVHQGKVRYLGCSNYPAWRLVQSLWVADRFGTARYDLATTL
jgi:aryl-alcohol dehydrogenase-like predicted oxidoreductase